MEKYEIGNNIRRLRFENNEMTQLELSKKANVSRQTIVAIEKDKYSPSLDLAFRIAQVFGVSINEVFYYQLANKKLEDKDEETTNK